MAPQTLVGRPSRPVPADQGLELERTVSEADSGPTRGSVAKKRQLWHRPWRPSWAKARVETSRLASNASRR